MSGITESYLVLLPPVTMGNNDCQNVEDMLVVKVQMVHLKAFLISLGGLFYIFILYYIYIYIIYTHTRVYVYMHVYIYAYPE